MNTLMIYIVIWLVAFVIGFIVSRCTTKKEKTVGTLVVDHESIPEDEPYLFLRTKVNPRVLMTKKTVVFDVVVEKLVSHE